MEDETNITFIEHDGRKSRLINLQEVLRYEFIIPDFQRPYAWTAEHLKDLLDTITENQQAKRVAFMGSIIVVKREREDHVKEVSIIDGQQRITSFLILLKFIYNSLNSTLKGLKQKSKELTNTNNEIEGIEKSLKHIEEALSKTRIQRESKNQPGFDILKDIPYGEQIQNTSMKKMNEKMNEYFQNELKTEEILKFLKYILSKCRFCFLSIEGDGSEDYAIDIFNSLNSTGEPLTAFEIFKSSMKQIGIDIGNLNRIESDLKEKGMIKTRQNKYTDRLLSFMNMTNADLHADKFSTFRDKRDVIDKISKFPPEKIEGFVSEIYELHKFILSYWEKKEVFNRDIESQIISNFLRSISHDRVLPILYIFKNQLDEAVKICVAFSCLWRGYASDGKTDGVDTAYADITKEISKNRNADIKFVSETMKQELITKIKKGKLNNNELLQKIWVERFKSIDLYNSRKLCRFFLFLAFHNRNYNRESKKLEKSRLEFLTTDNWNGKKYKTIEHIIPQAKKEIHQIGNLILLPQDINSKSGSKDFSDKKECYKSCLEEAGSEDLPYIRILKEIVSYDKMDDKSVAERGERLGRAIWGNLISKKWLGWDE